MESVFPRGKLAKRSHIQLRSNGWHITRGTQPERRVLCLESCCYNKSDPGPKPIASPNLDEHKPLLVCFESLLCDLLLLVYLPLSTKNTPRALLGIDPIIVVSPVPSCIPPSAVIALINRQGCSNSKIVLSILCHVSMISPMTSCIHSVLSSERI
jgi:hypothetical protein